MSSWQEYKKTKKYPALLKDQAADVCIIGGGIAGVLTAYRLSKAGVKAVLLERDEIGSSATILTTALITKVIDTDLAKVLDIFGKEAAKIVWESGQEAIDEFERIIQEEEIACEFMRCPNYIYASEAKQFKSLRNDYEFYRKLKIPAALSEGEGALGFKNYGYIKVPNQAKFHPAKFLYNLALSATRNGARIFEHSEALEIEGQGPFTIITKQAVVKANAVVIATYKPLTNKKTHLKKAMYRSYILEAEVPRGVFQEAIYEDSGNPYYYFRIDGGRSHDTIIIGGEDHKDIFGNALDKQSFQALGNYLSKLMAKHRYWIVRKWSGPILEPSDGLGLIGEIAPHCYGATGFSGNGMTYSMISSMLLTDLILGKKNEWAKVYDPKRTLLRPKRLGTKAKDYIEEFFGGVVKNLLS